MKFKTTIILFAVFLILLAFVYFFELKSNDKTDEGEKLVAFPSEDVERITLKGKEENISFQKEKKEEWLITEPLNAKADKYEVDRLADNFSDLKIERIVEEKSEDLDKYKIPQKEIHIWFKNKEEPVKILIGMENPLDNTLFAKREDQTRIVLLPSHLKNQLEKSVFDFRQKDIFNFEIDEIKSIKLKAKENQWKAERSGEEWVFKMPFEALAKASKIEDMLRSLSNLKAKEFVSEDKQKEEITECGLDSPEYDITLVFPMENKEIQFALNKKDEKLYATTSLSSKIIEADDSILSDLEKEAQEIREKEVASFYSWDVNKVHLRMGKIEIKVQETDEDKWHFESPENKEADDSKIKTFIRKIESLEAKEFIDPPLSLNDYGLVDPPGEVKLWVKKEKEESQEITLFFGTEDKEGKTVVVKNARLDYLFRVDSTFLEDFPKNIKDWEKKEN